MGTLQANSHRQTQTLLLPQKRGSDNNGGNFPCRRGRIAVITTRHFRHSDTAAPATEVQVQTASTQSAQSPVIEEPSEKAGSLTAENKSVVFEDETLRTILDRIARHYGTEIVYRSTDTGDLRLYFRWDTSARLEETVEALNNFEKINLSLDNNKITVL